MKGGPKARIWLEGQLHEIAAPLSVSEHQGIGQGLQQSLTASLIFLLGSLGFAKLIRMIDEVLNALVLLLLLLGRKWLTVYGDKSF